MSECNGSVREIYLCENKHRDDIIICIPLNVSSQKRV
jgi:hypothetical protein